MLFGALHVAVQRGPEFVDVVFPGVVLGVTEQAQVVLHDGDSRAARARVTSRCCCRI